MGSESSPRHMVTSSPAGAEYFQRVWRLSVKSVSPYWCCVWVSAGLPAVWWERLFIEQPAVWHHASCPMRRVVWETPQLWLSSGRLPHCWTTCLMVTVTKTLHNSYTAQSPFRVCVCGWMSVCVSVCVVRSVCVIYFNSSEETRLSHNGRKSPKVKIFPRVETASLE